MREAIKLSYKLKIKHLGNNYYSDVEIEMLAKTPRYEDKNSFETIAFISLDQTAELIPLYRDESNSRYWNLILDDWHDRKLLLNVKYLRFVVCIYQNSDLEPYPLQGRLIYRAPLIDRIFERPGDVAMRGGGNRVALYARGLKQKE
jgi:hypothetical protein